MLDLHTIITKELLNYINTGLGKEDPILINDFKRTEADSIRALVYLINQKPSYRASIGKYKESNYVGYTMRVSFNIYETKEIVEIFIPLEMGGLLPKC